jgi:ATP-dependent Clp protease ATP-binding subunit ClpA
VYERFTDRARKVMQFASAAAQEHRQPEAQPEHMLFGILKEGTGVAINALKNLSADLNVLRGQLESAMKAADGPATEAVMMGRIPYSPASKRVIERSIEQARDLNHNYVGTEHLLLGLLQEEEGPIFSLLEAQKISFAAVQRQVVALLGHQPPGLEPDLSPTPDPTSASVAARDLLRRYTRRQDGPGILGTPLSSALLLPQPEQTGENKFKIKRPEVIAGDGPDANYLMVQALERLLASADADEIEVTLTPKKPVV